MIHGVSTYITTEREGFARGWVEEEGTRGERGEGGEGSELRLKLPRDPDRP